MSGGSTDSTAPRRTQAGEGGWSRPLLPGTTLGNGRYRLLAKAGEDQRSGAEFWRAKDGALGRDVALTVLVGDPADPEAGTVSRRTLERAMHAASFNHPGVTRVLDVLAPGSGIAPQEDVLGIVVGEWTRGTDLIDLVAEGPLPAGTACRLLEPLAAAVEVAHHAGLVLGIDHPQRIRVTPEGRLRLAFAGPGPKTTPRDDVRGLGAALYLMLTGRWALADAPEGLLNAPIGPDGTVVAPRTLRPALPHELSTVAVRSLVDTSIGGVRTGAAILRVLEQTAQAEAETELMRAVEAAEAEGAVNRPNEAAVQRSRRRKLAMALAVLAAAMLAVFAWVGANVVNFFTDQPAPSGPTVALDKPVGQQPGPPQTEQPKPAGPVEVASVNVYDPTGQPDNANRIKRVVDGNPQSSWKTETYKQPFPKLKSGIGVMVSFAEAVKLVKVAVDSPSAGTTVEIRSTPSPGAELDQTRVIGTARLNDGRTEISISVDEPTQHVLLWITGLSGGGDKNASELSELFFVRAQ